MLAESKAKTFVGGSESLPMHCCYRMSEDGLWLVSAMCDGVGEMVETAVVSLCIDDADNGNERGDGSV